MVWISTLSFSLTNSIPVTWTSILFLEHVKHATASGPLQMIFPLPIFPPDMSHGLLLHLHQVFAQVQSFSTNFPLIILFKIVTIPQTLLSPFPVIFLSIALTTI